MPEWARGKTTQEIISIGQRMFDAGLNQLGQSQRPTAPPPPQVQTQAIDAEGYVTGTQMLAAQQQAFQQYVQPDVQAGIELGANANYAYVKREYQKEFSKYGPEIVAKLNGVPKKMWTLDNLETVVKLVRADHLDDYRAEWQTEVGARMEQTIRSGGAGGAAPVNQNKDNSLESEKIPDEWKVRARKAGLTDSTIQEFCFKNDMTVADFYKQFETPKGQIVAEVQDGR